VERREDEEEEKAAKDPITYTYLGSEECPTSADMEEIEYSMIYRIPKIENLTNCTRLTVSALSNLLETWPPKKFGQKN
jgi:hypothetical protein